jgi:hypothetical protein
MFEPSTEPVILVMLYKSVFPTSVAVMVPDPEKVPKPGKTGEKLKLKVSAKAE